MLNAIVKKEFVSLITDKRFWLLTGILLLLLIISLITTKQSFEVLNKERSEAQAVSRENWLTQSPKNPHAAAHFGNFAFRMQTPLSLFDDGLDMYTGTYVYLEPHKQNDFKFSQAQDATVISRFSHLTPAFILQTLLPLLIIFLCFTSVTKEREDSTLKLLLAQGCSIQQIIWGKVLGNFTAITLMVLLFFAISSITLMKVAYSGAGSWQGLLLLLACYLLYSFIFTSITIVVSAHSHTGRASLMKLLGIWIIACIILPKVSSNIAGNIYKTPSQFQFNETLHADELNGLNGHDPSDRRRDVLLKQTLEKYHVDTITKLPVNFDAVAMVESEKYTTMVYRRRFGEVERQYQKQNAVSEWCGFINPFQAVQYSSMALCGTAYSHFKDFHAQAERYRLYFVNTMNEFMSTHTKSGDWSTAFGKELFQTVHPFIYESPTVSWSLQRQSVSLAATVF